MQSYQPTPPNPTMPLYSVLFPCNMHEVAEIAPMPLFTADTARAAALLSHAPTSARHATAIPPEQPAPTPQPAQAVDEFAARRLTRVRDQLERLDRLASEEDDPKQLKALADATTRLSEQERLLAGRPLPGSRRPSADPKVRKSDWWIEMQPSAPAQVAPAMPAPAMPATSIAEVQPALPAPQVPAELLRLPGDVTP